MHSLRYLDACLVHALGPLPLQYLEAMIVHHATTAAAADDDDGYRELFNANANPIPNLKLTLIPLHW